MKSYELEASQLIKRCESDEFDFERTDDIRSEMKIIGQKRGLEAIDLGLDINKRGYNIFIVDFPKKRKLELLLPLINPKAIARDRASDLLYIYDSNDFKRAKLLKVPGGLGRGFKGELEEALLGIKEGLEKLFYSEDYIKERKSVKDRLNKKKSQIIDELKSKVEGMGYSLEKESGGFSIIPYSQEGVPMSEEYYFSLSKKEQKKINSDTEDIQRMLDYALFEVDSLKDEADKEIQRIDSNLAAKLIKDQFVRLYKNYSQLDEVIDHLASIEADIFDNLDYFNSNSNEGKSLLSSAKDGVRGLLNKYKPNLIVDNYKSEGAPVVFVENPTYYNLAGKIEYLNEDGNLVSSFNNIKAGAIHKANGGYLILEAQELLNNFKAWHLLKSVLKSGQLKIENLGHDVDKIPIASLNPDPVEVDLKVIILGDLNLYHLLYYYDEDFKDLFSVKAYFDDRVERSIGNIDELIKLIGRECDKEDLLPLDKTGVSAVIEYLSRVSGSQRMISTSFSLLGGLLIESDLWANRAQRDLISDIEVKRAIKEREERGSFYRRRIEKLYDEGKIIVDTEGEKVGEINGLSVTEIGESSFGRPTKITAVVYKGNAGIVNIESESKMSGKIHNKGVMTLVAYLGARYAKRVPLSLSASLSFEQLYSGVEGDSASSTQLYVILSSLAEVGIKQSIAVTGSINQKGDIQPVGGINEKIEGFFDLCKRRGLTGEEGVIIPIQNLDDLMVKDEVVRAVDKGEFHIWAISHIEEGFKLLMGKEAGKERDDGNYPPGTINSLVQRRVEELAQKD